MELIYHYSIDHIRVTYKEADVSIGTLHNAYSEILVKKRERLQGRLKDVLLRRGNFRFEERV